MKKFSVVLAAVVLLGFLLAWNPGFSEASVTALSGAQDPAQLATASILPVKVTSSTDTILVLYRSASDTVTGTANNVKLVFYTAACVKSTDVTIPLTPADVDLGDTTRPWVSDLFLTAASGVILGQPTAASNDTRWAMSGLVIDGDLGAVYERQGYPALVAQTQDLAANANSLWAGFSGRNFEDFYLSGSGFTTTIQLVCPGGTLTTDMSTIATIAGAAAMTTIDVYGIDEEFLNSDHTGTCACWKENPGAIATLMAGNPDVLGMFFIQLASGQATGSRVITYTGITGSDIYIDGRIRRGTTGYSASN